MGLRVTEPRAAAIVGDAVAAAAGAVATVDQVEQLPLFAVPTHGRAERVNVGAIERATAEAEGVRRGPGRPKGAENRATREWRDYLLRRGEHPLEWMMRWSMHTPESLAAELGCTKAEAFDRLAKLRTELAPYFMPKMQPVDEDGRPVPMVNLTIGGSGPGGDPALPPWLRYNGETAEISHSAEPVGEQSQAPQSHEGTE